MKKRIMEFQIKQGVETDFEEYSLYVLHILPIRPKTRESYFSAFKCHIQGKLVGRNLASISRADVQKLLTNLSPSTRVKVLAILKTIFREAAGAGLVEASPVFQIFNPQPIVKHKRFLTWEEVEKSSFGKYSPQVRFLALHGLRWGEAVALTTEDIRDGKLFITKSIHGPTKSQSGNRVVPLIGEFHPLPRSPKTLRKVLAPYQVTIHSLRHTYAYLLKSNGIHVSTAQRLLGHSDPRVTIGIYTQVLNSEIDEAGLALRKLLN
jgi:integrase